MDSVGVMYYRMLHKNGRLGLFLGLILEFFWVIFTVNSGVIFSVIIVNKTKCLTYLSSGHDD